MKTRFFEVGFYGSYFDYVILNIFQRWYFAMISLSGLFAVTFSVVFAYVADVTDESNRTTAYGLVNNIKNVSNMF